MSEYALVSGRQDTNLKGRTVVGCGRAGRSGCLGLAMAVALGLYSPGVHADSDDDLLSAFRVLETLILDVGLQYGGEGPVMMRLSAPVQVV